MRNVVCMEQTCDRAHTVAELLPGGFINPWRSIPKPFHKYLFGTKLEVGKAVVLNIFQDFYIFIL
jgi:hypothetical protein